MSLMSVLQARGAPLTEFELWSVLHETTCFLQLCDTDRLRTIYVNPYTLVLGNMGTITVQMAYHRAGPQTNIFLSSEHRPQLLTNMIDSKALERMHLYSLGIVLYFAADYRLPDHQLPELSENLESIIAGMVHELPQQRARMDSIVKACNQQQYDYGLSSYRTLVSNLSKKSTTPIPSPSLDTTVRRSTTSPLQQPTSPRSPSQQTASSSPPPPRRQSESVVQSVSKARKQDSTVLDGRMVKSVSPTRTNSTASKHKQKRRIIIELLDGRTTSLLVIPSTLASEAYKQALVESQLEAEDAFFGLSFYNDGDQRFLRTHGVGLFEQIPESCVRLYFRVEFYVENVSVLGLPLTRHLYYLQVKSDVVSGHTYASENDAVELAAMALQAEYGDFDQNRHLAMSLPLASFFPSSIQKTMEDDVVRGAWEAQHAKFRGWTKEKAEMGYLKEAQKLQDYGIIYYRVWQGPKQTTTAEKRFIGAGARGLILYLEKAMGRKVPLEKFGWKQILQVSSFKKKVIMEVSTDKQKLVYFAATKDDAQNIVNRIQSLHEFHKLIKRQYPDTNLARVSMSNEDLHKQPNIVSAPATKQPKASVGEGSRQRRGSSSPQQRVNDAHASRSRSPSTRSEALSLHSMPDVEIDTISEASWRYCQQTRHANGAREFGDPRLVKLEKDEHGLGINIVGGVEAMSHRAVYVKKVRKDKAAQLGGQLKKKDRLLEINGHDVIHATHEEAVDLIKEIKNHVYLVVAEKLKKKDSTSDLVGGTPSVGNLSPAQDLNSMWDDEAFTPNTWKQNGAAATSKIHIRQPSEKISISNSLMQATDGPVEEVVLKKGPRGIGMALDGGVNSALGGIFIRALIKGCAAAEDGRLCVGDRILKVDNFDLDVASQDDAVQRIQQSGQTITLLVQHTERSQYKQMFASADDPRRSESRNSNTSATNTAHNSANTSAITSKTVISTDANNNHINTSTNRVDDNDNTTNNPNINHTTNNTNATNATTTNNNNDYINDGNNNTSNTDTNTHNPFADDEVVVRRPAKKSLSAASIRESYMDQEAPDIEFEKVLPPPHADLLAQMPQLKPGRRFNFMLEKGEKGFGLALSGGVDHRRKWLYIKKVVEGSAAEQGGLVKNDIVFKINNVDAIGLTHKQALTNISQSGTKVLLLEIHRPHTDADRPTSYTAVGNDNNNTNTHHNNNNNNTNNGNNNHRVHDFTVTVNNSRAKGLGAKFDATSVDGQVIIRITDISAEGAIAQCEDVCAGDEILELADRKLAGIQQEEFTQLLLNLPTQFQLRLRRPSTGDDGGAQQNKRELKRKMSMDNFTTDDLWQRLLMPVLKAIKQGLPKQEYQELENMDYGHKNDSSQLPQNRKKNRYTDIFPHEDSRVILKSTGDKTHDYINANHVHLRISSRTTRHFIMSQGPLQNTCADFWRMIWENNCDGIVMVTSEVEKGKKKCHRYWPKDERYPEQFEEFQIETVNSERLSHTVITTLQLSRTIGDETRTIQHFRYKDWPDHGVPADVDPFIDLVNIVDARCDRSKPLVAHCSAGVGRSGVFVVISAIKQQLLDKVVQANLRKQTNPFDHQAISVKQCTMLARLSRFKHVIQTEPQYHFCYKAYVRLLEEMIRGFGVAAADETDA